MSRTTLASVLCLLTLLGSLASAAPTPVLAAQQNIYTDSLAAGWQNYSWATVNLAATSPLHSGNNSISVTYGSFDGLFLNYAGFSTNGFTTLRFWIHGGATGGQSVQVYAIRSSDPSGQNGPKVAIPAPVAGNWSEVQIPLANLGASNTTITGLVWQAATNGPQAPVYFDDIALIDQTSPDGPVVTNGFRTPGAAPADGQTSVVVRAQVSDPQGAADLATVTLAANAFGRGSISMRDDGRSNDGSAGDGVYGTHFTIAPGSAIDEVSLLVTASDQAGHSTSLNLGAFVILAAPGGAVPAALPSQIGWGSNEWNESSVLDWQVNSGVPWQYVYQYITYEWYQDGWGGDFVGRFTRQAWSKGYVPVISAYLMLATPPACGEGGICYAQKLKDPAAVSAYLAAIEEAARQAKGDKPVIMQIDPDFFGFMQQLSNDSNNRPAGVLADDPNSYPVALNVAGYPNTFAGFGRRIVDIIHSTAPNVLVGLHASAWATNQDPNNVTAPEAIQMARRIAGFLGASGGDQADLLFVEWSDRDAGSGLRPFWDDTNRQLPRPSRALLWENTLSATLGKRLILWQVPCGNMALDNSPNHYQDNRVAYAFRHPRDLADTGVIAVLFGGGASGMTGPSTDGGFIQAQATITYDPPAAPANLSVVSASGPTAVVRWDENSEPDLWGYRVSYSRSGGPSYSYDARRANTAVLVLPDIGAWTVTVRAYDAQNRLGAASTPINLTTTVAADRVSLPLVVR